MLLLDSFRRLTRTGKLLVCTGVATVVYALLGFLVVPAVLERQLPGIIDESLGRTAAVEQIRLNPFALSVTVRGFSMLDGDGSPFATFDELYANLQLSSIFRRAFTFRELRLTAPWVHIKRLADGTLNVADLAAEGQTEEAEEVEEVEEPAAEGGMPVLIIERLALERGKLSFSDRTRASGFDVEVVPVDISVESFTTRADTNAPYSLVATRDAGERLEWTGTVSVNPLRSAGMLTLSGIRPRLAWEYLRDDLGFEVADGRIDASAEYALDASGEQLELELTGGKATLRELQLIEEDADAPLITLNELAIDGIRFDLAETAVAISSLRSTGARLRCWLEPDGTFGYLRLFDAADGGEVEAAAEGGRPTDAVAAGDDAAAAGDGAAAAGDGSAAAGDDTAAAGEETGAAGAWSFRLDQLTLADYGVEFEDRTTPTVARVRLQPIALELRNVTNAGEPIQLTLDVGVGDGGRVSTGGELVAEPPAVDLDLDVESVALGPFQPYIDTVANLDVTAGTVGLDGALAYRAPADGGGSEPSIRYRGGMRIDGLHTVDKHLTEDFLVWSSLVLDGMDLAVEPSSLKIDRIALDGPQARIIVGEDGVTNVARLARAGGDDGDASPAAGAEPADAGIDNAEASDANAGDADGSDADGSDAETGIAEAAGAGAAADDLGGAPEGTDTTASAAMPVAIDEIAITGGTFTATDRSVQPVFSLELSDVTATIAGLSSEELARADVDIRAKLDKHAPLAVSGQINPLSGDAYTDLAVKLQSLGLAAFTPYSGRYVGQAIEKGKLTLDLHYKLSRHELVGENSIVLDRFTLGRRIDSPDATSLPVGLALALLKDASGKIDIDLPVGGNVDSPDFSLGDIILDALVNLITKAAASPFALIGSVVGGSGEDLSYVAFAAGHDEIDDEESEKLATLARALEERPALRLDVMGAASAEADAPALAEARLQARLKAARFEEIKSKREAPSSPDLVVLDEEEYVRQLRRAYAEAFDEKPRDVLETLPDSETDDADPMARLRPLLEERLLARITISESDLRELAQRRSANVHERLIEAGVAADRVFVLEPVTDLAADGDSVRTNLMLAPR